MDNDILGLSCVENHVLNYIKPRCSNFGLIYYDSFISSRDIFEKCKSKSFECFDGIDRIQDVLKHNKLLKIDLYKADFVAFLDQLHNKQNINAQVLMQVDSVTAQQKFFARGLRNDHYISIECDEGCYTIINDIPYKKLKISVEELVDIFAGYYLIIEYKDRYLRRDFDFINESKKTNTFNLKDTIDPDAVYFDRFQRSFTDMLIIIRILRQRLSVFLNSVGINVDIQDFISNYSRLLAQSEYMRIKKICDIRNNQILLSRFNQWEEELFEVISNVYGD